MRLNDLADNPGAVKERIRVGRGIGSGKGKTGGRGVKGQKARTGVAVKGFEGGQMPIHRRLPKRGFVNPNGKVFNEISLSRLSDAVSSGRLDATQPITIDVLVATGLCDRARDGVRVVGDKNPTVTTSVPKVILHIAGISAPAKQKIEAAGGVIEIVA
jgi:large subunit ribosomal protein L15